MGGTSRTWTDERIETMSRLWKSGSSAAAIAAELGEGITRNTVIGKLHRLGLMGQGGGSKAGKPQTQPRARKEGRPRSAPPTRHVRPPTRVPTPPPTSPPTAPFQPQTVDVGPVPESLPVGVDEVRDGLCRWPLGEPGTPGFRFCGAPAEGSVYCSGHARIAYVPRNVSAQRAR